MCPLVVTNKGLVGSGFQPRHLPIQGPKFVKTAEDCQQHTLQPISDHSETLDSPPWVALKSPQLNMDRSLPFFFFGNGGALARWASFFDWYPPVLVFAPTSPNNLEYLLAVSQNLTILYSRFMMMARVVFGNGGSDICVVEFSCFSLCKVLCREGLRYSAVYLGDFPR